MKDDDAYFFRFGGVFALFCSVMRTGGDDIGERKLYAITRVPLGCIAARAKAFRQFVVSRAVNVLCACLLFVCLFAILLKDPDKTKTAQTTGRWQPRGAQMQC